MLKKHSKMFNENNRRLKKQLKENAKKHNCSDCALLAFAHSNPPDSPEYGYYGLTKKERKSLKKGGFSFLVKSHLKGDNTVRCFSDKWFIVKYYTACLNPKDTADIFKRAGKGCCDFCHHSLLNIKENNINECLTDKKWLIATKWFNRIGGTIVILFLLIFFF